MRVLQFPVQIKEAGPNARGGVLWYLSPCKVMSDSVLGTKWNHRVFFCAFCPHSVQRVISGKLGGKSQQDIGAAEFVWKVTIQCKVCTVVYILMSLKLCTVH